MRPDEVIADIGPLTQTLCGRAIARARTVIWNGPMGRVEERPYAAGTRSLARALLRPGRSVLVGGGDTVAFLSRSGLLWKFRFVSTGGGAMLAYLAGERLPGLIALSQSGRWLREEQRVRMKKG
jgi:phosphoglycerate kinase